MYSEDQLILYFALLAMQLYTFLDLPPAEVSDHTPCKECHHAHNYECHEEGDGYCSSSGQSPVCRHGKKIVHQAF